MVWRKRWVFAAFLVCALAVIGFGIWLYSNRKYEVLSLK